MSLYPRGGIIRTLDRIRAMSEDDVIEVVIEGVGLIRNKVMKK